MAAQGIDSDLLSRPIRLAADLSGKDATALEDLFTGAKILVRLEEAFADVPDARETFLFTVNQVIRFCPNVAICAPAASGDLVDAASDIAVRVHGERHRVHVAGLEDARGFQAIINVGTEVLGGLPSVSVNSTGWVARVATADSGAARLPSVRGASNPIGALAAACFGAGRAFFCLIGQPLVTPPTEISLFTLEVGRAATLPEGPPLPVAPVELDGFLVGCGAVTNGWAYTVKRLPIVGHLEAVDRQVLGIENIGPYVASGREWLGKPKAEMIAAFLGSAIAVTPRPDEWEFFKIRLRYGLRMPPVVVNGLDNIETRHSVQRLWPEILIDMASGGLTSQVILKAHRDDGICLLRALDRPAHEVGWAERLARETGLPIERIVDGPTTAITGDDIAQAPADKRAGLERARENGQLVCGRVTEHNLSLEGRDTNFAPAVPFVTGFSGVAGAAATMKWLMGYSEEGSFHFQHSFVSGGARKILMKCDRGCECWTAIDQVGVRS